MSPAPNESEPARRAVAEILARRAVSDAEAAAREWVEAGFDDPEEVEAWLDAGCPEAAQARLLDDAGITPEQAALRAGPDAPDTLARRINRGDLTLEEARRIITREFWND